MKCRWGIGALDGLDDGYLEALGAVTFMAAEAEVVERLLAAAAWPDTAEFRRR